MQVKTAGSRVHGNLRPETADNLPKGFNMLVLEYLLGDSECVIEVWCSDSEVLAPEERKGKADLDNFCKDKVTLSGHPKSPLVLGSVSMSHKVKKPKLQVDKDKKTMTVNGKEIGYLKMRESKTTSGEALEEYVVDEG